MSKVSFGFLGGGELSGLSDTDSSHNAHLNLHSPPMFPPYLGTLALLTQGTLPY